MPGFERMWMGLMLLLTRLGARGHTGTPDIHMACMLDAREAGS